MLKWLKEVRYTGATGQWRYVALLFLMLLSAKRLEYFLDHPVIVIGLLSVTLYGHLKNYHWLLRLLLAWLTFNCISTLQPNDIAVSGDIMLRYTAMQSTAFLLALAIFLPQVTISNHLLSAIYLTHCAISLYEHYFGQWRTAVGFFDNYSFSASFTACLLPLAPWWALPFGLWAIYLQWGVGPWVIVGVMVWLMLMRELRPVRELGQHWCGVFFVTLVGIVIATSYYDPYTFYFQDRLNIAWMAVADTVTSDNWLMGRGPGSFLVYGPILQMKTKVELANQIGFTTVHNDLAQLFFEHGVIGAGLMLITYCLALCKLYTKDFRRFLSLIGFGIFGLVYFPLEVAGCALIVWALMFDALKKDPE